MKVFFMLVFSKVCLPKTIDQSRGSEMASPSFYSKSFNSSRKSFEQFGQFSIANFCFMFGAFACNRTGHSMSTIYLFSVNDNLSPTATTTSSCSCSSCHCYYNKLPKLLLFPHKKGKSRNLVGEI